MRYVYGSDGGVAATIDSSGFVMLGIEPGAIVGLARSDGNVYADEAGSQRVGYVDADGNVMNDEYERVAIIDGSGRVIDRTGHVMGKAERPVDGAVLALLIARLRPEAVGPVRRPASGTTTMMDEALSLSEEHSRPGIRKNYKPLTDEDVFGLPHRPQPPKKKK